MLRWFVLPQTLTDVLCRMPSTGVARVNESRVSREMLEKDDDGMVETSNYTPGSLSTDGKYVILLYLHRYLLPDPLLHVAPSKKQRRPRR